ncbi:hypothetical protein OROGR_032406 [Orobanche gracilis]
MSGPIATCAGLSGGAQPPRDDPPRLLSQCDSDDIEAAPPAPRKRKGRGPAKGEGMLREIADGRKIRVPFDMETDTFKGLDRKGTWYDSAIGILTREHCEPYHDTWSRIPLRQRTQIFERLLDWFNIDYAYENGVYRDMVERDAKKCYSEWKSDLHAHFKQNGGLEDLDRARASVPENIRDPEHWARCCIRFSSPEFLEKSATNSSNRGQKQSKSKQGRIPYTRHRANKSKVETQEPKSLIENWKELNPDAEAIHRLLEERVAQAAANGDGRIDECAILADVLGTRRGHMNGVGPSLSRRISAASQPSASGSAAAITEEYEHVIRALQGYVDQQNHVPLSTVVRHIRELIGQLAPHVQLPHDVPPPSPPPPVRQSVSSSVPPLPPIASIECASTGHKES